MDMVEFAARVAQGMQDDPIFATCVLTGYASKPGHSFEAMVRLMSKWDEGEPGLEEARREIRRLGELLVKAADSA